MLDIGFPLSHILEITLSAARRYAEFPNSWTCRKQRPFGYMIRQIHRSGKYFRCAADVLSEHADASAAAAVYDLHLAAQHALLQAPFHLLSQPSFLWLP